MSSTDYITRKEFEERMRDLSAGIDTKLGANTQTLSEALGMLKVNQGQIQDLVTNIGKMQDLSAKHDKQIAISSTMNKVLWPIVTVLVAALSAVITLLGTGVHL
jgi:hypothetical protein